MTKLRADRFVNELGKRLSKRTLMMIKSTLRRSIRRAQVHDLIARNVVELVDLPVGQPGHPSRAMTEAQAAAVLKTARCFAMTNLGITFHEGKNFNSAIDVLTPALEIHEETGARRAEGSTLNHLGMALSQSGQHQEGLVYLIRARELSEALGDCSGWAASTVNIGSIYREIGDAEMAKSCFLEVVDASEKAGDLTNLAMPLWNLAVLSRDTNDPRAATGYLERLRAIPQNELPLEMKKGLFVHS